MLLQHLHGLSDLQAEVQLGDRLSFQKFVGVAGLVRTLKEPRNFS